MAEMAGALDVAFLTLQPGDLTRVVLFLQDAVLLHGRNRLIRAAALRMLAVVARSSVVEARAASVQAPQRAQP